MLYTGGGGGGGNLDIFQTGMCHSTHMTNTNKNRSFHWININAIQDQVNGHDLPDYSATTLEETHTWKLIPEKFDCDLLKKDFISLWSRVVVRHLENFRWLKQAIVYRIPHQYSVKCKNRPKS